MLRRSGRPDGAGDEVRFDGRAGSSAPAQPVVQYGLSMPLHKRTAVVTIRGFAQGRGTGFSPNVSSYVFAYHLSPAVRCPPSFHRDDGAD